MGMRSRRLLVIFAILSMSASASAPAPFYVFFGWNSVELTPDARATLDNAAAAYLQVPGAIVEVIGRSDRAGPRTANLHTSRARAERVKAHLVARSIPAGAVRVYARGERDPIVATADGVREAQNRSVEIRFLPGR